MKLEGKSVLITGGAGFIGSHLADGIVKENPKNLVIVDNFFLGSEQNLQDAQHLFPMLKVYRLDASDLAAMRQVVTLEQIDIVFNLAVVPLPTSLEYPAWTVRTNIEIASTFCELARWGLIDTLVHCSSSEAYGSALYSSMDESHPLVPTTPYAASKASADQIVISYFETYGIDATIVRPFNNFGPRQNPGSYAGIIPIVIGRIERGEPIEIFGDGLQTRDYIFVRYTVQAIVRIYETRTTRGKIINVATGHEITINDLVQRLMNVMGYPTHPIIHTEPRAGDVRRHCGDVSLLQRLTGYNPRPITDGDLSETIEWYLRKH